MGDHDRMKIKEAIIKAKEDLVPAGEMIFRKLQWMMTLVMDRKRWKTLG